MLHFNSLTYRLGERLLIDDATVALPARARVGLVGRNGAGKTTLFRLIAGELSPESGSIGIPKGVRLGRVEQEAPGGEQSLIDFVLEADMERAALLAEAEHAHDPHRIADIHTRLVDIDSHSAPARAARILSGLGFDEAAQNRHLRAFSGGWRMRVALAAVLFSAPDLLLLDEPTNYLDLEGALWLVDYLKSYPASVLVISHDRDILDDVAEHILHLDRGKLTLWSGGYSQFERQRREAQILAGKAIEKQEERRKHLQAFVDRFRAKASKASQAQSRLKMLERMQPITAIVDENTAPFTLPSAVKRLSPPIIVYDKASVGYGDKTVLRGLSMSLQPDDRVGLIGSNGNGKSTFAKLLAGRMEPMAGETRRHKSLRVGYFAQHQLDELGGAESPYGHVALRMKGANESAIRARAASLGFSGDKAFTAIDKLSGGEKARLLMGLAAFDAPELLILDEPTNHLDIDSRAELVEAINEYEGAVIIISHDRRLLESTVDRLWLVAGGSVRNFEGDIEDYRKFVLAAPEPVTARGEARKEPEKRERPMRERAQLQRDIAAAEARMTKLQDLVRRIDESLAQQPPGAPTESAIALVVKRGDLERAIEAAEEQWLELSVRESV